MKLISKLWVVPIMASAVSCHKPPTAIRYDENFEVLRGTVKQIIEVNRTAYSGRDTVVIDFDLRGNITQADTKGDCNCLIKRSYKYDKEGKLTEAIAKIGLFSHIYKYDPNGRIVETTFDSKELKANSDHITKQEKFFYKYNAGGDLTEADRYFDTAHLWLRKFKYNDQHLLIGEDQFSGSGYHQSRTTYKYQSVDKNGNWLKRTSSAGNDQKSSDTSERKIIYYERP